VKQQALTAITNAHIVLETGILWDGALLIQDGKIAEVAHERELSIPSGAQRIDAHGSYVGPGFVDIHVHEALSHTTYYHPEKAADYFLAHGTTSFLATPPYELAFDEFLEAICTAKQAIGRVKSLKGLYMEGPYINTDYGAYAHLNPWRGAIDEAQFKALVDAAGTAARVWTIAAEREGILPFLEYARKVNPDVVFANGHSEATPAQIRSLGKYRPTLQTHSMCATGRHPVPSGTRGYGPDEYCLCEPDVYTELISDSCGIHVHGDMQRLLLHSKGVHRVVLITDSTYTAEAVPEQFAHVTDLNFDDQGGLAGSKLTMDRACRNVMMHTNSGIAQAFIMASLNPARVIGLDDEIGSIEVGKQADLVFVDDTFNVQQVMLGGTMCHFGK